MKKKILLSIVAAALSLSFLLPSASANRQWETAAVIAGTAILAGVVLSQAGSRVHYCWNWCPPPPRTVVYVPASPRYYHPKWRNYSYHSNNRFNSYPKWNHRRPHR